MHVILSRMTLLSALLQELSILHVITAEARLHMFYLLCVACSQTYHVGVSFNLMDFFMFFYDVTASVCLMRVLQPSSLLPLAISSSSSSSNLFFLLL